MTGSFVGSRYITRDGQEVLIVEDNDKMLKGEIQTGVTPEFKITLLWYRHNLKSTSDPNLDLVDLSKKDPNRYSTT